MIETRLEKIKLDGKFVTVPVEFNFDDGDERYCRSLELRAGVWRVTFENEEGPYRVFLTRDRKLARQKFEASFVGDVADEDPNNWERYSGDYSPLGQWLVF